MGQWKNPWLYISSLLSGVKQLKPMYIVMLSIVSRQYFPLLNSYNICLKMLLVISLKNFNVNIPCMSISLIKRLSSWGQKMYIRYFTDTHTHVPSTCKHICMQWIVCVELNSILQWFYIYHKNTLPLFTVFIILKSYCSLGYLNVSILKVL